MKSASVFLILAAAMTTNFHQPADAQGFGGALAPGGGARMGMGAGNGGVNTGGYGSYTGYGGYGGCGLPNYGTYGAPSYGGYGLPGYGGYGVPNYAGRPLGSFGNIGNPYGAGFYNNPNYGAYGPIGAPIGAPIYGVPVAAPGGYFRLGPLSAQFWQSPSGYYYPWGGGAVSTQQNVYYVNQGNTTPAKPPIPTELSDMDKYLTESRDKGRVADSDYQHLFRRLQDLRGKYSRLSAEWDGLIDPGDEERLRKDVDLLSSEISQRIRPAASSSSSITNARH